MAKCMYGTKVEPRLEEIKGMYMDGLSDRDVIHNLGISEKSFYTYKNKYPEFAEAVATSKVVADYRVQNSLYRKCIGYKDKVKKSYKTKEVHYQDGKKVFEKEVIKYGEDEVLVQPDTMAIMYWLNNRKPANWSRKDKDIDASTETMEKLNKIIDGLNEQATDENDG